MPISVNSRAAGGVDLSSVLTRIGSIETTLTGFNASMDVVTFTVSAANPGESFSLFANEYWAGEPVQLLRVDDAYASSKNLLILVTTAPGYVPAHRLIVQLPAGYDGVLRLANETDSFVQFVSPGFIRNDGTGFFGEVSVSANSLVSARFRDVSPGAELYSYARFKSVVMPAQVMSVCQPGPVAAGPLDARTTIRGGAGKYVLGSAYSESSTAPSEALTVIATVTHQQPWTARETFGTYRCSIGAGTNQGNWWYSIEGDAIADGTTIDVPEGCRIEFSAEYAAEPAAPMADLRIDVTHKPLFGDTEQFLVP